MRIRHIIFSVLFLILGMVSGLLANDEYIFDMETAKVHQDSLIDNAWTLQKQFPFFRKEIPTGSSPKSCEFSPDGKYIYVTLLGQPHVAVQIYTVNPLEKVAEIRPGCKDPKNDYGYAEGCFHPKNGRFWFTRMTTGEFFIYHPESDSLESPRPTGGVWTKALEFSPDNKRIAMTNWVSRDVTVFNTENRKMVKRFKVRNIPRGMAWIGNDTLAVAIYGRPNSSDGGVEVYDVKSGKCIHYIHKYRSAMRDVRYDPKSGYMYFDDMRFAKTYKYDWRNREDLAEIDVDSHPNTIKLSKDGKYLFVSCRGPNNPKGYTLPSLRDGEILMIDTETFTVKAKWAQGNQPTGLDISHDGRYLATTDFMQKRLNLYVLSDKVNEEITELDIILQKMGDDYEMGTRPFWRWW